MTHQHGPLDFDPTATNRRVPLKVIIIVAVGSKSNGPCWWVMRIPTICLGGDPNPLLATLLVNGVHESLAINRDIHHSVHWLSRGKKKAVCPIFSYQFAVGPMHSKLGVRTFT